METHTDPNDYDLEAEYDFSKMTTVAKGRFSSERRLGTNVVVLDGDLAQSFPTDDSVNRALRLVLAMSKIPAKPLAKKRAKVAA